MDESILENVAYGFPFSRDCQRVETSSDDGFFIKNYNRVEIVVFLNGESNKNFRLRELS
jgi:hypothetical protein